MVYRHGWVFAALLLLSISCDKSDSKNKKGDVALGVKQAPTGENLEALFKRMHKAYREKDAATYNELARSLICTSKDAERVLRKDPPAELLEALDGAHDAAQQNLERRPKKPWNQMFRRIRNREIEVKVFSTTGSALATASKGSTVWKEFPGGARRIAKSLLRPEANLYEVQIVERGEKSGTRYHLFFWSGEAWKQLGALWQFGVDGEIAQSANGKVRWQRVFRANGEPHFRPAGTLAITPDGRWAISGGADDTVKLWDVAKGRLVRTLKGHEDSIECLAISTTGKHALSGSADGSVLFWDLREGKQRAAWEGHKEVAYAGVNCIAFSPDGSRAVSGSGDKTLKLWDVPSGKRLATWTGHQAAVYSVAFHPDGLEVLSGSRDGTLKVWNVKRGREVASWNDIKKNRGPTIMSIAVSPDGKFVLSGVDDKTIRLWEMKTGKNVATWKGHGGAVTSLTFSRDGKRAISSCWKSLVKLWDVVSGKEIDSFYIKGELSGMTSNGDLLLVAKKNTTIGVFRILK